MEDKKFLDLGRYLKAPFCVICVILLLLVTASSMIEKSAVNTHVASSKPVDWIVQSGENIIHNNTQLTINGNITVDDGGQLTLNNVSLKLNSSDSYTFKIEVKNNASLTITNGTIISTEDENYTFELHFERGSHGSIFDATIKNCGFSDGSSGGVLIESDNVTITRTEFYDNYHGIVVESCSPVIWSNKIHDNQGSGIIIMNSTDMNVTNNEIYNNNGTGIKIVNSQNISLNSNSVRDNKIGISLDNSSFSSVDNYVKGNLDYGYLIDDSSAQLTNDLILENKIGIKAKDSNVLIKDARIRRNGQGIVMDSSSFVITDCVIMDSEGDGVEIKNCLTSGNEILRSTIKDNNGNGITIVDSKDIQVVDNEITYNNKTGIHITTSTNITMKNNKISDNNEGIYAKSSTIKSIENEIFWNFERGINLDKSQGEITKNTISESLIGIKLVDSSPTISETQISDISPLDFYETSSYDLYISKNSKPTITDTTYSRYKLYLQDTTDMDGDFATDSEEKYMFGTDASDPDSDDDGLLDGEEAHQDIYFFSNLKKSNEYKFLKIPGEYQEGVYRFYIQARSNASQSIQLGVSDAAFLDYEGDRYSNVYELTEEYRWYQTQEFVNINDPYMELWAYSSSLDSIVDIEVAKVILVKTAYHVMTTFANGQSTFTANAGSGSMVFTIPTDRKVTSASFWIMGNPVPIIVTPEGYAIRNIRYGVGEYEWGFPSDFCVNVRPHPLYRTDLDFSLTGKEPTVNFADELNTIISKNSGQDEIDVIINISYFPAKASVTVCDLNIRYDTEVVSGQISDPLEFDTDFDGISDGIERDENRYWFEAELHRPDPQDAVLDDGDIKVVNSKGASNDKGLLARPIDEEKKEMISSGTFPVIKILDGEEYKFYIRAKGSGEILFGVRDWSDPNPNSWIAKETIEPTGGFRWYSTTIFPSRAPKLPIVVTPTFGTAPLDVIFSAPGKLGDGTAILSYHWDFGDGEVSNLQNPVHTYTDPGYYLATLTATDSDGLETYASEYVTVNTPLLPFENRLEVTISGEDVIKTTGVAPLEVSFIGPQMRGDGTAIVSYHWDFGDGEISTEQSPVHMYPDMGEFLGFLIVEDGMGIVTDTTILITVEDPGTPQGDQIDVTVEIGIETQAFGNAPLEVSFYAPDTLDDGTPIIAYQWDFGDGEISDEQNPVHLYPDEGDFITVLIITDLNGTQYDTLIQITVNPGGTPHGDSIEITVEIGVETQGSGMAPLEVSYFAPDTMPSGAPIVSYLWEFGDGGTSNLQNPVYVYSDIGDFITLMTVEDDTGVGQTTNILISVLEPGPPVDDEIEVVVDIGVDNYASGNAILEVSYIAPDIMPDGTPIVSYHWDFGDGTISDIQNPIHIFQDIGDFITTLMVIDDLGNEIETLIFLTVSEPGAPGDNQITLEVFCEDVPRYLEAAPLEVLFSGPEMREDGTVIETYFWDFGNGMISEEQNPVVMFEEIMEHHILLTLIDDLGFETISTIIVTVDEPEIPDGNQITVIMNEGDYVEAEDFAPLVVSFVGPESLADPAEVGYFFWDLGDGTITEEINPVHNYSLPGDYLATLTVEYHSGSSSISSAGIKVIDPSNPNQPPSPPPSNGSNDIWMQLRVIAKVALGGEAGTGAIVLDKLMIVRVTDDFNNPKDTIDFGQITDPLDPDTDGDDRGDGQELSEHILWIEAEDFIYNPVNLVKDWQAWDASNKIAVRTFTEQGNPNRFIISKSTFVNDHYIRGKLNGTYKLYFRAKTQSGINRTLYTRIWDNGKKVIDTSNTLVTGIYRWYSTPFFDTVNGNLAFEMFGTNQASQIFVDKFMFVNLTDFLDTSGYWDFPEPVDIVQPFNPGDYDDESGFFGVKTLSLSTNGYYSSYIMEIKGIDDTSMLPSTSLSMDIGDDGALDWNYESLILLDSDGLLTPTRGGNIDPAGTLTPVMGTLDMFILWDDNGDNQYAYGEDVYVNVMDSGSLVTMLLSDVDGVMQNYGNLVGFTEAAHLWFNDVDSNRMYDISTQEDLYIDIRFNILPPGSEDLEHYPYRDVSLDISPWVNDYISINKGLADESGTLDYSVVFTSDEIGIIIIRRGFTRAPPSVVLGQITDPLDPDTDMDSLKDGYEVKDTVIWFEAEDYAINTFQIIDSMDVSGRIDASNGKGVVSFTNGKLVDDKKMTVYLGAGTYKVYVRAKANAPNVKVKIYVRGFIRNDLHDVNQGKYRWYSTSMFTIYRPSYVRISVLAVNCVNLFDINLDKVMIANLDYDEMIAGIEGQTSDPLDPDIDWDGLGDGREVNENIWWFEAEDYTTNPIKADVDAFNGLSTTYPSITRDLEGGIYTYFARLKYTGTSTSPKADCEFSVGSALDSTWEIKTDRIYEWYQTPMFVVPSQGQIIIFSINSGSFDVDKIMLAREGRGVILGGTRTSYLGLPMVIPSQISDPFESDSDGDDMLDGDEIFGTYSPKDIWNRPKYRTDPLGIDLDWDHLSDALELGAPGTGSTIDTNPNYADTDRDFIPDGWIDGWGFNLVTRRWEIKSTDGKIAPLGYTVGNFIYMEGEDIGNLPIIGGVKTVAMAKSLGALNGVIDSVGGIYVETDPTIFDTDEDGIKDCNEFLEGTDPLDADSDDDGIKDGQELNGLSAKSYRRVYSGYGTDPLDPDTDNDGLSDGLEVGKKSPVSVSNVRGTDTTKTYTHYSLTPACYRKDLDSYTTNPKKTDSDGDGIPDGWIDGTQPLFNFSAKLDNQKQVWEGEDLNLDGKANTGIWNVSNSGAPSATCGETAAHAPDTDGGGLWDGKEIEYDLTIFTNSSFPSPLIKSDDSACMDNDTDGLLNILDAFNGKDYSNDADSDDDGLLDGDKYEGFDMTNDIDSDGIPNALDYDSDGDNLSDGLEVGLTKSKIQKQIDEDVDADNIRSTDQYNFIPDTDASTTTDPWNRDTDDDGLPDGWIDGWNYWLYEYDWTDIDDGMWGTWDDAQAEKCRRVYFRDESGHCFSNGVQNYWEGEDFDLDGAQDHGDDGHWYNDSVTRLDTDGDGYPDYIEDIMKTNRMDATDHPYDQTLKTRRVCAETNAIDDDTNKNELLDGKDVLYGNDPYGMDTDGDGLYDFEEPLYGCDVNNPDSDNDWLMDGYEVFTQYYGKYTDPTILDTDGDRMPDGWEAKYWISKDDYSNCDGILNPTLGDTDGDGIKDGDEDEDGVPSNTNYGIMWSEKHDDLSNYMEYTYGIWVTFTEMHMEDWFLKNPGPQTESRILEVYSSNLYIYHKNWKIYKWNFKLMLREYHQESGIWKNGTSPLDCDFDDDGLWDGAEVDFMTNPFETDTDGDTLDDGQEVHHFGSNPARIDTDSDGLDDYEEMSLGYDGLLTTMTDPDTDGDGYLDGEDLQPNGEYDPMKWSYIVPPGMEETTNTWAIVEGKDGEGSPPGNGGSWYKSNLPYVQNNVKYRGQSNSAGLYDLPGNIWGAGGYSDQGAFERNINKDSENNAYWKVAKIEQPGSSTAEIFDYKFKNDNFGSPGSANEYYWKLIKSDLNITMENGNAYKSDRSSLIFTVSLDDNFEHTVAIQFTIDDKRPASNVMFEYTVCTSSKVLGDDNLLDYDILYTGFAFQEDGRVQFIIPYEVVKSVRSDGIANNDVKLRILPLHYHSGATGIRDKMFTPIDGSKMKFASFVKIIAEPKVALSEQYLFSSTNRYKDYEYRYNLYNTLETYMDSSFSYGMSSGYKTYNGYKFYVAKETSDYTIDANGNLHLTATFKGRNLKFNDYGYKSGIDALIVCDRDVAKIQNFILVFGGDKIFDPSNFETLNVDSWTKSRMSAMDISQTYMTHEGGVYKENSYISFLKNDKSRMTPRIARPVTVDSWMFQLSTDLFSDNIYTLNAQKTEVISSSSVEPWDYNHVLELYSALRYVDHLGQTKSDVLGLMGYHIGSKAEFNMFLNEEPPESVPEQYLGTYVRAHMAFRNLLSNKANGHYTALFYSDYGLLIELYLDSSDDVHLKFVQGAGLELYDIAQNAQLSPNLDTLGARISKLAEDKISYAQQCIKDLLRVLLDQILDMIGGPLVDLFSVGQGSIGLIQDLEDLKYYYDQGDWVMVTLTSIKIALGVIGITLAGVALFAWAAGAATIPGPGWIVAAVLVIIAVIVILVEFIYKYFEAQQDEEELDATDKVWDDFGNRMYDWKYKTEHYKKYGTRVMYLGEDPNKTEDHVDWGRKLYNSYKLSTSTATITPSTY